MQPAIKVALLAAPLVAVPPAAYGGAERVIASLADELHRRGHDLTVFASGDSRVPGRLVAIVPAAVWAGGSPGMVSAAFEMVAAEAAWRHANEFDIIHSHLGGKGFSLARHCGVPVISTMHTALDGIGIRAQLREFAEIPLVAISNSQRQSAPDANWVATIHNGLPLRKAKLGTGAGSYLAFVGRASAKKGVAEAVEVARLTGIPLKIAAKVHNPMETMLFDQVVRPAVADGVAEYCGELPSPDRDDLLGGAIATLMLGDWPEPFGLVAVESMATGTPVIARRAGALVETVRPGLSGYLVDSVAEAVSMVEAASKLDRRAVRQYAVAEFSSERMADGYEDVYRQMIERR